MRICACLAAVVLLSGVAQQPAGPAVRFHHVHFVVDDPASAMGEVIEARGGTRVILPGLGVGVRVIDEYLLFERAAAEAPPASIDDEQLRTRYAAAARAFAAAAVTLTPPTFDSTRVAASVLRALPSHLAFASADVDGVAMRLQERGAQIVRRTSESWFLSLPDAGVVEITTDTDRPDAVWCPMHPDVRSASPGKCPICGMDLVAIPPPRIGEYRLDLERLSRVPGTTRRKIAFRVREAESDAVVDAFTNAHEQLLHLFVIGRDLGSFAHEHPKRNGDRFELDLALEPGSYMLIADFLPTAGSPQMVHHAIVVPGSNRTKPGPAALVEDRADKVVDGLRVRMESPALIAGRRATVRFNVAEAASGKAVTDLQPYLAASGHLLIVSSDLTQAVHAHPDGAPTSGPTIEFDTLLPDEGLFKLWMQFQRGGQVRTVPFVVRVGPA